MSTEYYTGVVFERAKAKLLAACGDQFAFEVPEKRHYLPECQEFKILHLKSGGHLWCLREVRDFSDNPVHSSVTPPVGTLTLERFGGNKVWRFIPWIERTLGVRVMSEVGLPWELDQ